MEYVFVLGAGQGILLALFLLNKKENRTANKMLAFTLFAFSIDLFFAAYAAGEHYLKYPDLIASNVSLPYLFGPCIFLYISFLGHPDKHFKVKYLLHFIPFLIVNIIGFIFFYFADASYKLAIMLETIPTPLYVFIISYLVPVSGSIYSVLTIRKAAKFNKQLKNSYSNIERINLNWINFLAAGTLIIWFIVILSYFLDSIYGAGFPSYMLIYISVSVLIYSIGYKSLSRPEVKIEEEPLPEQPLTVNKPEPYKKSGLSEEAANEYLERLLKEMEDNKPYLENNLSLSELSKNLDISTHNLSELINTRLNQNFYDFINKYRVEEVKRLIENDKENLYNILALGFEAGFSSKSAFYTSFKKVTGITPAQYRDQTKENS